MSHQRFTVQEKHELVLQYLAVPFGQRSAWAQARRLNRRSLARWRQQVMTGLLERDMTVRGGVLVPVEENAEIARLHAVNEQLRQDLEESQQRVKGLEQAVKILGKATEVLQDATAGRPRRRSTPRRR